MIHTLSLRSVFTAILFLCSLLTFAQQDSFLMGQIGPNNLLNHPWDLEYGPDGLLWVTERERGSVVRIDPVSGAKEILATIPGVYTDSRQDGLLGMALHPDLMGASPYVYLSYTYRPGADRLQRLVRYTFSEDGGNGTLQDPITLLDGLPASNDHNSGRLIFGPDQKLYYTIGDQGGNQNSNYCNPVLSQMLPTQEEINDNNWANYPGKVLRINPDGSIPADNPVLSGVRSHIFTYGHRNAQGIVFGSNGLLYSNEHGPDTDDEVNLLAGGMNYGWPRVVGFKDDQAYDYCDWSSLDNCSSLTYDKFNCPEGATFLEENTLTDSNYQDPIFALFAVSDDYDFNDPNCGNSWLCRPNVAPSSLGIYESDAIPGWNNSLLVVSLKRGRIYRLQLNETGTQVMNDTIQHFYSQNRYRDIAVSPDGKSIFVITDQQGNTSDASGLNLRRDLLNPGAILKFTYDETTSTVLPSVEAPFSIYPNPASDQLNIKLYAGIGTCSADLLNIKGQSVASLSSLAAGINQLSVKNLPAGVYSLRVTEGQRFWTRRVVVR